jgi:epoxyqueuosine reductase QueG
VSGFATPEQATAAVDEPPQEAVAVLRDAMEDDEPLVREHAGWALEQLE